MLRAQPALTWWALETWSKATNFTEERNRDPMSAPLRTCRGRGLVVVLATGAAISLTALTGGITPSLADPATGPTTTPVSPPKPGRQDPQPARTPDNVAAPPSQAPPVTVIPSAPPVVEAPPQTKPQVVTPPSPATVIPSAPPMVEAPPQTKPQVVTPAPVVTTPAPVVTQQQAPVVTQPPAVSSTVASPPVTATEPPKPPPTALQTTPPQPVTTTIPSYPNPVPRNTSAPVGPNAAPPAPESSPPPTPPSEATSGAATASGTPAPTGGSPVPVTKPGTSASAGTSSVVVPSASSPVSQAGQVAEIHQAEKLQAPQQDVELARASAPIEQGQDPAATADVDNFRNAIRSSNPNADGRDGNRHDWHDPNGRSGDWDNHDWDQPVRQWDRDWVRYDDYYRPILCNPYRNHFVRVIYIYEYRPVIVVIPPLASVVLNTLAYGAYNFTALVADAVGTATDVAVGSFFGSGYYPGQYLAPPPPPPPLQTYDNVPVFVNYRQAAYEPFTVQRIVDVGDDTRYGERKVLLDGVTPVWGVWTQTPDGQRQFEVHKTQQLPGLDDPQEGPLPGDYQLRLTGDNSSGFTARDVFVMVADAVVATLALCAAVAFGISRRRSRTLD
jgi:hypothetical protein